MVLARVLGPLVSTQKHRKLEGAKLLIPPLDRALGALIPDLIDRGLYQRTLVVVMGEFGRTPRMNKNAGRDHWGNTFSVLIGCGGMRMVLTWSAEIKPARWKAGKQIIRLSAG